MYRAIVLLHISHFFWTVFSKKQSLCPKYTVWQIIVIYPLFQDSLSWLDGLPQFVIRETLSTQLFSFWHDFEESSTQ